VDTARSQHSSWRELCVERAERGKRYENVYGIDMGKNLTLRGSTMQDIGSLSEYNSEFHNFHVRGVPDRLVSISDQPDIHEGTELYQVLRRIVQS
jgi:hypothetical protein